MSNLTLLPITGHTNSNEDVATFLRELADIVESSDHSAVRQVAVIVEAEEDVETWVAGGPWDNARIVGLMTIATARFMQS